MKYIGLEACCLLDIEEICDEKEQACCINDISNRGVPGARCFDTVNRKYCKSLMFSTAKASIIVTNHEGDGVNGTCYFEEIDLSSDEWTRRENKWIAKQQEYLKTLREK